MKGNGSSSYSSFTCRQLVGRHPPRPFRDHQSSDVENAIVIPCSPHWAALGNGFVDRRFRDDGLAGLHGSKAWCKHSDTGETNALKRLGSVSLADFLTKAFAVTVLPSRAIMWPLRNHRKPTLSQSSLLPCQSPRDEGLVGLDLVSRPPKYTFMLLVGGLCMRESES
jgi:hypothetical protein